MYATDKPPSFEELMFAQKVKSLEKVNKLHAALSKKYPQLSMHIDSECVVVTLGAYFTAVDKGYLTHKSTRDEVAAIIKKFTGDTQCTA